jgi:hypothetical protein
MDTSTWGWKEILGIIIIIYFFLDVSIVVYNIINERGLSGCAKETWKTIGPFSGITKPDTICTKPGTGTDKSDKDKGCSQPLGMYSDFAKQTFSKDKQCLCPGEVHSVIEDTLSNNIIEGYTPTQLAAYIIVPFLTTIGIIYAFIFTRISYAEWIFWILIATIIFTGLTSISYTTEIPVLPEQHAPLSYITKKLSMSGADELKYSFMARKQDGSECLVEGTMLGGGTHPENQPPTYTGTCTAASLPMY